MRFTVRRRPETKTAHLFDDEGRGVAMCGRPGKGPWPGRWEACEGTPDAANRCADCDACARNRNRRPTVPQRPWNARQAVI